MAGQVFAPPADSCEQPRPVELVARGIDDSEKSHRTGVEHVGELFELHAVAVPRGRSYLAAHGKGVEVEDVVIGESVPGH